MFEAAMEHFAQGLALLSQQDISAVPPRQLGTDIQRIRGVINRAEAQCVRRVELFDREQAYGSSGDTSTTNWLRNHCQLSGFAADKHVKLARQLPELQATQQALESGEIGIGHALEVARATDDMGAGAEAELLSAARTKDPAEVRQAAREIRHRVDAEGMARQAMEQFRKRRLHLFELPDGMVGVEGALPPEGGAALRLTLESLTGVPPKDDERTPQQRRADALMELCRRQLDSGTLPSLNGRKPHLTVVVQAETLAGAPGAPAARLEGAGPISGETARRLLCGCSASVLKVDGKGVALDLGRAKRLASEPQRQVWWRATRAAWFPAAVGRPASANPTTSTSGRLAEAPGSTGWCCCARSRTIRSSTRAIGNWPRTRTGPSHWSRPGSSREPAEGLPG
jgi:hypothetical protein